MAIYGYHRTSIKEQHLDRGINEITEFGKEEKNAISHRGRAFKKFLDYLNHLNN